jgi:hypothetical protein
MANNTYPLTTLRPRQRLEFCLSNGKKVRTVLLPRPNNAGTRIAHVELDYSMPGSDIFNPIGHEGLPRTLIEAATLAYQIALSQSGKEDSVDIVEVLLEGEQFLERADLEAITGATIPVKVIQVAR